MPNKTNLLHTLCKVYPFTGEKMGAVRPGTRYLRSSDHPEKSDMADVVLKCVMGHIF